MTGRWLKRLAFRLGYDFSLRRLPQYETRRKVLAVPRDMEPEFVALYERCAPFTMTSAERMYALYQGVRHVVERGVAGEMVECGVWRGGSAMLIALTLIELGAADRRIVLFDTFAGMTRPEEVDRRAKDGSETVTKWEHFQRDGHNDWAYAPLDEVRANMAATGYPADRIEYVQGEVEATLPGKAPARIALLRLDTDWYRSTYHEMRHLFPQLAEGGVLVLDDYGSFEGARKAVDQYMAETGTALFLHRIDSTGRIAIKGAGA